MQHLASVWFRYLKLCLCRDGVVLTDESGNAHGSSVIAGQKGLAQIALTRVVLPIPILLLPPFILDALRNSKTIGKYMASSKSVRIGVELAVIGVFLQCALPMAIALFPQRNALSPTSLEPAFASKINPTTGKPVESYYFNKGV